MKSIRGNLEVGVIKAKTGEHNLFECHVVWFRMIVGKIIDSPTNDDYDLIRYESIQKCKK